MAKRSKRGKSGKWVKSLLGGARFLLLKAVPLALLGIGLAGLVYFSQEALSADPHLRIKTIQVTPSIALAPAQRAFLESRYLGKHILRVQLNQIAREIESDPEVLKAEVVRRFPSTLDIQITRREPLGVIRFGNRGRVGIVSRDGMVLQILPEAVKGMTLMEAPFLNPSDLKVGFRILPKGFHRSAELIELYRKSDWVKTFPLEKVTFDALGNVSVYFPNAPEIRMGRNPAERIGALEKVFHLLGDKESLKIAYIDLQFDNIIVKKKG